MRTDHGSLSHLLSQKIATLAQQVWVAKLLGYDFVIEYKAGVANAAADALSQIEESHELRAISRLEWVDMQEVLCEQEANEYIQGVVKAL